MSYLTAETEPKTKGEVYLILKKFNEKAVRADMLDVIKTSRNCSIKEARDIKRLKASEVAEILKRFE